MILNITIATEKKEDDFLSPTQDGNAGLDVIARKSFIKGSAVKLLENGKTIEFQDEIIPIDEVDRFYFNSIDYIQYDTEIQVEPSSINIVSKPMGLGSKESTSTFVEDNNGPYFTLLFPRSSLSKYNLQLANSVGVIDRSYRGNIILRFNYVWQPSDLTFMKGSIVGKINKDKIYENGNKVGQLVVFKEIYPQFIINENLTDTERGKNGFGSTGE